MSDLWRNEDDVTNDLPSFAIYERGDNEATKLSRYARRALRAAVEADNLEGFVVQNVRLKSGERIWVEMRGQSSFTAHGRQGLRPDRAAFLRDIQAERAGRRAVLLVFFEGESSWYWAWLHDLGEATAISLGEGTGAKRFGWYVSEMTKGDGEFRFPAGVTYRSDITQGSLL
jgi:hypothetical protein